MTEELERGPPGLVSKCDSNADLARGYTVRPAKPPFPERDRPLSLSIGEQ